jgi:pantoate--beta-alanine ligase
MFIFHHINDLQQYIGDHKKNGATIGFVPTMGALHSGHISLINTATQNTDIVVCSIFVNPTQFNNQNDFEKYPKTIDADIQKLESAGCHALYLPEIEEIYPQGFNNLPHYDLGEIESKLEGSFRPEHFQGVAIIVDKLLHIVNPNHLFMGQKDFQQCMIVQKLLQINQLPVDLNIVPTKREQDGLAMSSRNVRLSEGERQLATLLYQCLVSVQAQKEHKSFKIVVKECKDLLAYKGVTLEYLELCNAHSLDILEDYNTNIPMVALIAAYVGEVRLIDNLVL